MIKAMAKWPNVPAVYGWLSLDRRGQWRLRGEVIGHEGAIKFIARNYQADEKGCWHFQNGPQKVYVDLDYTPLVFFLDEVNSCFEDHCGRRVESIDNFWLDEEGALLLSSDKGPGLIYDQDLATVLEWMQVHSGDETELERALEIPERATSLGLRIQWQHQWYAIHPLCRRRAGPRLGFEPRPERREGATGQRA